MYKNLRDFVRRLDREGELCRVDTPVSPILEISEIVDRVSKGDPAHNKALLFENTGTEFPLLINAMGSDERMSMALGVNELDELRQRLNGLVSRVMGPKESMGEKLRMLPLLAEMSRWFPKKIRGRGACQKRRLTSLEELPVLKCWPADGGRFITLPLVHTADPETGTRNVGMYRMQLFDGLTTGMHWHIHKTGARHYEGYKKAGRLMPVTVTLGGDPAYTYAATAPMPDNMDEYLLAGFLRKKPVKLVKCLTNDLWVPEDSDFVIEGYVDPSEDKVVEGPFGDHTGFYSAADLYPKFHVTAITCRKNAIYPATLVGIPPQEDACIARATEKIFLTPLRLAVEPEIVDMHLPMAGVAHNLAIVSIEKRYAGQVEKVAHGLWGAGQMMFTKYLIVVNSDVDVRSRDAILDLLSRAEFPRDLIHGEGPLDVLDHSSETPCYGGKLCIDLTHPTSEPHSSFRFLLDTENLPFDEQLWLALANSDPAVDARVEEGVLILDGRTKPHYPAPTVMDSATKTLVDRKWTEYGF